MSTQLSADTRARILEAAWDLARKRGSTAVSVKDIAAFKREHELAPADAAGDGDDVVLEQGSRFPMLRQQAALSDKREALLSKRH